MPADGVVQIAFDRYLLPRSITRQAVTLVDGNDQVVAPGLAPKVTYDPIARTVTLSSPNPPGQPWLTEGQFYKVRLEIAPGEDDDRGLRAIDRAPLDPNQNRVFGFLVGPPSGAPNAERGGDPTVDYCVDIAPIFFTKCNGGTCHGESTGTPTARAGLLLATQRGVAETAIGRLAHGTSTTGSTRPSAPLSEFGVDMPLIDPGNPGNSFLLYKIELAPPPSFDAGGRDPLACPLVVASSTDPDAGEAGVGDAGTSEAGAGTSTTIVPAPPPAGPYRPLSVNLTPADDLERAILSDYIIGREMPYPSANVSVYGQQALTLEEREHLRAWIAQGARLPSAGACKCAPLPAQPFTTATLQAYFSSRCSPCHTSSTSGGLSLNDFQTTTINVPAVGLPSMARITPGDPSQSYLVRKIEGTHRDVGGTGGQMPLGGPALAAGDIDLIKRYVTELATAAGDAGAGDAGADASDAATD